MNGSLANCLEGVDERERECSLNLNNKVIDYFSICIVEIQIETVVVNGMLKGRKKMPEMGLNTLIH